jgi:hypothetical protein
MIFNQPNELRAKKIKEYDFSVHPELQLPYHHSHTLDVNRREDVGKRAYQSII